MLHLKRIAKPDGAQVFDLGYDLPADTPETLEARAVETLLYAALFTDQRAPTYREPDAYHARGWWHEPEAGSVLWHVRRQPLSDAAWSETIADITRILNSYSRALSGVTVQNITANTGGDAGTGVAEGGINSALHIRVLGKHNGREFVLDLPL